MNRVERTKYQHLDRALAAVEAAEKTAVLRLNRHGFNFTNIGQARLLQARRNHALASERERAETLSHFLTPAHPERKN